MAPHRYPVRSLALATLLVGMSACGATEDGPAVEGVSSAEATFVPPRDADILVATVTWDAAGTPVLGAPTNLTQRPDYDNQPHFVPDGSGLWYTANDPQSGQTDIWRYDFATSMVTRVTQSAPESEYSATPLPDGSGISTIRVEADSTQRLWRFEADGSGGSVILEEVAPVGYHAWVDDYTVLMFVLGSPATLQRGDTRTGEAEVLAQDIGRSIQRIPNSSDISFAQRHADGTPTIMRIPSDLSAAVPIITGLEGSQDHAWGPSGTLLQASGSVLYAALPAAGQMIPTPEASWEVVADFTEYGITLSRLAVSPDGSQIALVAEVAAIDPFAGN